MTNSETLHKILNLRCSHHTKHGLVERKIRRQLSCETLSPRCATHPEDGEMESGIVRFASSNDDTSPDRRECELERTR